MTKKLVYLVLIVLTGLTFSQDVGVQDNVNSFFGSINNVIGNFMFFKVFKIPFIVLVLALGGLFFTFRFGFVNIRLFFHSFKVIAGKYDDPNDQGEITHFQALTSALSATVGLGNIAGVAVAISIGGAGAVFWMWITAFFGMSLKFSCCALAQIYRKVAPDGRVLGGPMVYIQEGFEGIGAAGIGKFLAGLFAILTIFASFGGGNLFQANQTFELISGQFSFFEGKPLVIGITLAFLVGVVIIGGIKRIGDVTSKLVPTMCLFYIIVCLIIILTNFSEVPAMFASIFKNAIAPESAIGGFFGVLVQGVQRASFSNEAGIGSAAIAHSAAKTKEPVREGVVAMIGPFIDTHLVCTMTALAILITNAHLDPQLVGKGAQITAKAFSSVHFSMPYFLTIAASIFAYSTMVSWSYYGERATEYLFGRNLIWTYRIFYVLIIIVGPMLTLHNVVDFADLMLLSMAFPNILGMIVLSGKLKRKMKDYISRLDSGEIIETSKELNSP
ncbi:MAG: alanine:cation symporter family protein [Fibrobacteria bacterium]|nr:alanine:cation symporter family protein [Fibrobacteria bacterium]